MCDIIAIFLFTFSITIPEKLEYFINKYAEHSHDKWSMEKVKTCIPVKAKSEFLFESISSSKYFTLNIIIFISWYVGKI